MAARLAALMLVVALSLSASASARATDLYIVFDDAATFVESEVARAAGCSESIRSGESDAYELFQAYEKAKRASLEWARSLVQDLEDPRLTDALAFSRFGASNKSGANVAIPIDHFYGAFRRRADPYSIGCDAGQFGDEGRDVVADAGHLAENYPWGRAAVAAWKLLRSEPTEAIKTEVLERLRGMTLP